MIRERERAQQSVLLTLFQHTAHSLLVAASHGEEADGLNLCEMELEEGIEPLEEFLTRFAHSQRCRCVCLRARLVAKRSIFLLDAVPYVGAD